MLKKEVFEKGNEFFTEPDFIIDMYSATFEYVSDKALDMFCCSKEELEVKKVYDYLTTTPNESRKILLDLISSKKGQRKITFKNSKGEEFPIEAEFRIFTLDRVLYIVAKIVDE